MNLSKNFTLEELTYSKTAVFHKIDNTPDIKVKLCLTDLCTHILQPLRDKFGPVHINCGYRSKAVNAVIPNASNTSQHCLGQAADISLPNMKEVFKFIEQYLPFDQLIWENGDDNSPQWIHVSYGPRNRREVLRKKSGKPGYTTFKV